MTHPHLDQRSIPVTQRQSAFSPYRHLVHAPVSPLESHTSAPIAQHNPTPLAIVDGEILTSTVEQRLPSLLRRIIDDPYWILMTLATALGVSITATIVYGVIQITLTVAHWFTTNAATLGTITGLIIMVMLGGGATAVKCAGIHCAGCRG